MAQAAIPLMVAGAVVKTVGGWKAASHNASVLRQQALEEQILGNAEVQRVREAARTAMGRQVSFQAESGFQPGAGSALSALEESLVNRELDILSIRRTAQGRANGLNAQAKQVKRAGYFAAAGDLIGAAGAISGYKADYAAAGASGG